jgi:hypothetical protein
MKFAKIVFWCAGIWGVLVLTPLYFMFDRLGQQYPPAITHPDFYYGFVGVALAWQIAFMIIASDPARFRLLMIPSLLEKVSYCAALFILYFQRRLGATLVVFGVFDGLFAILFAIAFVKTRTSQAISAAGH